MNIVLSRSATITKSALAVPCKFCYRVAMNSFDW